MNVIAAENPRATQGANLPPIADLYKEQNEALPAYLDNETADLIKRTQELLDGFTRAPDVIEDKDTAGRVSDFIAQITKCVKSAEAKRVDIKAGPLEAGRIIDGHFSKNIIDALDTPKMSHGIKQKLLARLTTWDRKVAEEERRRREEEARIAQAAAAEARRLQDEEAARARAAVEAIANEKDLARAIELEAQQKAAAEEARRRQADAEKAAAAANAKAAEMGTTRGEYGSASSLRTTWKGRRIPNAKIDLAALADYIPADAIDKAINAFAKIHKNTKPVAGVEFYEDQQSVVRG